MPATPTAVPTLPTPATRLDPTNFRARADARNAAEPAYTAALNALGTNAYNNAVEAASSATQATGSASTAAGSASTAATQVALAAAQAAAAAASAASALAAPNTSATSTTSVAVGTGTKVFTTQTGKPFATGQAVIVSSRADPRIYMLGSVTSYSGSTLTINALSVGLPSTAADWDIAFTGALPVQSRPGTVLRTNGAMPCWGDARGPAVQLLRRTNMLLWSEDFSNAVWARAGTGSVTTGLAGAPDGSATFSLLNDTDATFDLAYWQQTVATTPAVAAYCGSVYVAPGTAPYTRLQLFTVTAGASVQTSEAVQVEWATMTVTGGGFIEAVPGVPGVYRMWREIRDVGGGASIIFRVYASNGGASQSGTTKVWGAMLNTGRVPGIYAKTTSTTSSAPAARTQRLLYTENLANAAWSSAGTVLVNEQYGIGPQGRQTACVLNDVDTIVDQGQKTQAIAITGGLATYAGSVKLKYFGAARSEVFLYLFGGTTVADSVTLVWDVNGVPTVTAGVGGEVVALPDGWYMVRIKVNDNNSGNSQALFRVYPAGSAAGAVGATLVDQPVLDMGHRAPNYQRTSASTVTAGHVQTLARTSYHVDTALGPLVLALPDSAQPDDWLEVVDVGGAAATNTITLLPSGDLIAGVADDPLVININNATLRVVKDITKGWVLA